MKNKLAFICLIVSSLGTLFCAPYKGDPSHLYCGTDARGDIWEMYDEGGKRVLEWATPVNGDSRAMIASTLLSRGVPPVSCIRRQPNGRTYLVTRLFTPTPVAPPPPAPKVAIQKLPVTPRPTPVPPPKPVLLIQTNPTFAANLVNSTNQSTFFFKRVYPGTTGSSWKMTWSFVGNKGSGGNGSYSYTPGKTPYLDVPIPASFARKVWFTGSPKPPVTTLTSNYGETLTLTVKVESSGYASISTSVRVYTPCVSTTVY